MKHFIIIITGILFIVLGTLVALRFAPDDSTYGHNREWCEKEGGHAVYVGYSNTWNCEFGI